MKIVAILTIAAATVALTINAQTLQTPRTSAQPAVAGSGVNDPNLISGARQGKRTVNATLSTTVVANDSDTLAGTKCAGMQSKAKDTSACAEHCKKFGKQ